jgi:nicotinamide-nucleotide amidase
MFPDEINRLAREVVEGARRRGWTVTAAESCTGGLVSAALTDVPGASEVLERSVVTYSNGAKTTLLGVPAEVLAAHGAVSAATAEAMAAGARAAADADLAVAVTGVAGPGGGSADKPVGLVWFGLADRNGVTTHESRFGDLGRGAVRAAAVTRALELLARRLAA